MLALEQYVMYYIAVSYKVTWQNLIYYQSQFLTHVRHLAGANFGLWQQVKKEDEEREIDSRKQRERKLYIGEVRERDVVSFEVLICRLSLEPITAAGNN